LTSYLLSGIIKNNIKGVIMKQLYFNWGTTSSTNKTKIYFACPSGKRRDGICEEFGTHFGACVTPYINNNITIGKMPFFFDNGAYKSFSSGTPFDSALFIKKVTDLEAKMQFGHCLEADFIVIPDIVGGGDDSLDFSLQWLEYIEDNMRHIARYNLLYLPVQDNMDIDNVERVIKRKMVDGLFVGGSKPFKYEEGQRWVDLAHKYGLPIHCGGIGTKNDITWAKEIGFDSVDSGIAMLHPHHLWDVLDMEREALSCA
jgi:hypothetical protein